MPTVVKPAAVQSVNGQTGDVSGLAEEEIGVSIPVYQTVGDVPDGAAEGEVVYIVEDATLFVEDGT